MFPEDFEDLDKIMFEAEMTPFYDYLESMERFLDIESQKHLENLKIIQEKISSGEIIPPRDPGQMPTEMEYDYFQLDRLVLFENILRKSFFISIYTFLESSLMQHCRYLEETKSDILLSLSEIAGEGIHKAMIYLIKVQRINFSLSTRPEWSEIRQYNRLRNCIVHNEGKLNEGFRKEQRDQLANHINQSGSGLTIFGDEIILDEEFCKRALDTIKRFLTSVLFAETPV
jgi:hypothetical protein